MANNLQAIYMDVASYYPRVPNECFIQRTTAMFIRKSIGHIGVLLKNEKCILPYHYGIADVLFMRILIDVGLF